VPDTTNFSFLSRPLNQSQISCKKNIMQSIFLILFALVVSGVSVSTMPVGNPYFLRFHESEATDDSDQADFGLPCLASFSTLLVHACDC